MINFILLRHGIATCNVLHRNVPKRSFVGTKIKKVLIANRGEIACRVAKTAKKLGIEVVAVYSDADANSLHVSLADESHHIGPAPAAESYLRADKLLNVAVSRGCQAIHPGYGFLSENADFSDMCQKAGITFIGPPTSAIRDMGCKRTSKKIMEAAGVAVIKGYHGDDQSDARLKEEADNIGYPVMLKAVKGGGGKGMRVVRKCDDFNEHLASARNEASKAFGDSSMLVEKFVSHPRHVEVQVFGDCHGNYVHLHERDCSVQRRHQKVIEEAPAPGLPAEVRVTLGESAVRAARAVGYVGAGTVEFILDADSFQHFFMEMNTRLQVEHPVTEMITGTDLVEWQFKVATGEKLPLSQKDIPANGHAFEARIYAEDPDQGFLPQAGMLKHFRLPKILDGVRVDTGVRKGDPVPVFYDPLIAKLVVWGENRNKALNLLEKSLANFQVSGVPTNVNFLRSITKHNAFENGEVHTSFIEKHNTELFPSNPPSNHVIGSALGALLYSEVRQCDPGDVFLACPGFRINHSLKRNLQLNYKGKVMPISVIYLPNGEMDVHVFDQPNFRLSFKCNQASDGAIEVGSSISGLTKRATVVVTDQNMQVFTADDGEYNFEISEPAWIKDLEEDLETGNASQQALSPMPGVIDQVMVTPGDKVTKGQALVTVIAMKMEYVVRAPTDGVVAELLYTSGHAVAKGAVLVRFVEETTSSQAEAKS